MYSKNIFHKICEKVFTTFYHDIVPRLLTTELSSVKLAGYSNWMHSLLLPSMCFLESGES